MYMLSTVSYGVKTLRQHGLKNSGISGSRARRLKPNRTSHALFWRIDTVTVSDASNPNPERPDDGPERDREDTPETPPTEPPPVPVQDPPASPGPEGPYVVTA
jgi:hypothetical protein